MHRVVGRVLWLKSCRSCAQPKRFVKSRVARWGAPRPVFLVLDLGFSSILESSIRQTRHPGRSPLFLHPARRAGVRGAICIVFVDIIAHHHLSTSSCSGFGCVPMDHYSSQH